MSEKLQDFFNKECTPEPWVFDKELGVISEVEENPSGEPMQVATEVSYADGPLLAAAPELYTALRTLVTSYEKHNRHWRPRIQLKGIKASKRILNKLKKEISKE